MCLQRSAGLAVGQSASFWVGPVVLLWLLLLGAAPGTALAVLFRWLLFSSASFSCSTEAHANGICLFSFLTAAGHVVLRLCKFALVLVMLRELWELDLATSWQHALLHHA